MANPRGYRDQDSIPCCANCTFGGYLGDKGQQERLCICEIMGKCIDGRYYEIAVEPLGLCDAWKPGNK